MDNNNIQINKHTKLLKTHKNNINIIKANRKRAGKQTKQHKTNKNKTKHKNKQ